MTNKIREFLPTLLLCLSVVLCSPNVGMTQQSPTETSMQTSESTPLKTVATITDLKTMVPTDGFYQQVPALRELDYKIGGMNFAPSYGKENTNAKEILFENSKGESGTIRIFTKTYTQMQTSFDLEVYRIQIDSSKRYVLWTVAVQPMGGADNLVVVFAEKDSIDPLDGVRNPETAAGCFDGSVTHCPQNSEGSTLSGSGGISDPAWNRCFREVAHEISECVAWEGFTESCASGVASAVGAWCP